MLGPEQTLQMQDCAAGESSRPGPSHASWDCATRAPSRLPWALDRLRKRGWLGPLAVVSIIVASIAVWMAWVLSVAA